MMVEVNHIKASSKNWDYIKPKICWLLNWYPNSKVGIDFKVSDVSSIGLGRTEQLPSLIMVCVRGSLYNWTYSVRLRFQ